MIIDKGNGKAGKQNACFFHFSGTINGIHTLNKLASGRIYGEGLASLRDLQ